MVAMGSRMSVWSHPLRLLAWSLQSCMFLKMEVITSFLIHTHTLARYIPRFVGKSQVVFPITWGYIGRPFTTSGMGSCRTQMTSLATNSLWSVEVQCTRKCVCIYRNMISVLMQLLSGLGLAVREGSFWRRLLDTYYVQLEGHMKMLRLGAWLVLSWIDGILGRHRFSLTSFTKPCIYLQVLRSFPLGRMPSPTASWQSTSKVCI